MKSSRSRHGRGEEPSAVSLRSSRIAAPCASLDLPLRRELLLPTPGSLRPHRSLGRRATFIRSGQEYSLRWPIRRKRRLGFDSRPCEVKTASWQPEKPPVPPCRDWPLAASEDWRFHEPTNSL